jgi:hypothetical protein
LNSNRFNRHQKKDFFLQELEEQEKKIVHSLLRGISGRWPQNWLKNSHGKGGEEKFYKYCKSLKVEFADLELVRNLIAKLELLKMGTSLKPYNNKFKNWASCQKRETSKNVFNADWDWYHGYSR